MQQQSNNSNPPTLMQQAYFIAKSLRSASYWLFALTFSLLFFSVLALLSYIAFTKEVTSNIITFSSLMIILLIGIYIAGWFIVKARREYGRLNTWNETYLHSSYTLIFDTTVPKGNTTGEKVLNLAKYIFPELRDDFVTSIWDEPNAYAFVSSLVQKILGKGDKNMSKSVSIRQDFTPQSYALDFILKTKVGYFIVKDFGNKMVTVEDINQLLSASNKLRGKNPTKKIFRVICVAEEYEQDFLIRDSLEKLMTKTIQSNLKIDLLNKETNGYSVLWIS